MVPALVPASLHQRSRTPGPNDAQPGHGRAAACYGAGGTTMVPALVPALLHQRGQTLGPNDAQAAHWLRAAGCGKASAPLDRHWRFAANPGEAFVL